MSIYFAKQISTDRPTGSVFQLKGIKNLAPCPLSDLHILGIRTTYQVAYDGYFEHLPAFLAATASKKRVPVSNALFDLPYHIDQVLDIAPPPTMFYMPGMTEDQVDGLIKKTEKYKPEKIVIGKRQQILFHALDIACCTKLVGSCDKSLRARTDELTIPLYDVMHKLLNIAGVFLATQTYSARKEVVEEDMGSRDDDRSVGDRKPKVEDMVRDEYEGDGINVKMPVSAEPDINETATGLMTLFKDEELPDPKQFYASSDRVMKLVRAGLSAQVKFNVHTAKPSPKPMSTNVGGVSQVPESPGILFPYFPRMILPDNSTLANRFHNLRLYRLLGSDTSRHASYYAEFHRTMQILSDTEAGTVMSHLYTGIALAVDTQTRLFVLIEGREYLGFCLLGSEFHVMINANVHKPVSSSKLAAGLSQLSSHQSALQGLCDALSDLEMYNGEGKQPVDPVSITSSGVLYEEMEKRKIDKKWGDKELLPFLRRLRFTESFLSDEPKNITAVLLMTSAYPEQAAQFSTRARYIVPDSSLLRNPLYKALALFGPEAPSPRNSRGTTWSIVKPTEKDGGKEDDPAKFAELVKKNPLVKYDYPKKDSIPKKLIFTKKPVVVAFEDWEKVRNGKEVIMDSNERAANHRCLVISSNASLMFVWKAMGVFAHFNDVLGKRKRDDEAEVGPSKKQAMSADALLDMF